MKIEHIALWVRDLEMMKNFYVTYFDCKAGEIYHNTKKDFTSYFLFFEKGCRLELMHMPGIPPNENDIMKQHQGFIHFAVSVGNKNKVDSLTEKLRNDGYEIIGEPRTTGDGYYESVIFDTEDNRIEITI
jgi:lactoylglutathione lyase